MAKVRGMRRARVLRTFRFGAQEFLPDHVVAFPSEAIDELVALGHIDDTEEAVAAALREAEADLHAAKKRLSKRRGWWNSWFQHPDEAAVQRAQARCVVSEASLPPAWRATVKRAHPLRLEIPRAETRERFAATRDLLGRLEAEQEKVDARIEEIEEDSRTGEPVDIVHLALHEAVSPTAVLRELQDEYEALKVRRYTLARAIAEQRARVGIAQAFAGAQAGAELLDRRAEMARRVKAAVVEIDEVHEQERELIAALAHLGYTREPFPMLSPASMLQDEERDRCAWLCDQVIEEAARAKASAA